MWYLQTHPSINLHQYTGKYTNRWNYISQPTARWHIGCLLLLWHGETSSGFWICLETDPAPDLLSAIQIAVLSAVLSHHISQFTDVLDTCIYIWKLDIYHRLLSLYVVYPTSNRWREDIVTDPVTDLRRWWDLVTPNLGKTHEFWIDLESQRPLFTGEHPINSEFSTCTHGDVAITMSTAKQMFSVQK